MKSTKTRVAILGGGITGLSAAFQLMQQNIDCVVYEGSDRVGGVIQTNRADGFMSESGPNSILDTHPDIGRFVSALGLDDQKEGSRPAAKKRFIIRDGKPIALPGGPLSFWTTSAFSLRAKLRLMLEPFIKSKASSSEPLADFVVRRLGQEFLDYAINPFVGGVYAGDPTKLSTELAFPKLYALEQKYGSLLKGAFLGAKARKKRQETASKDAHMFSFKGGMETLPLQIEKVLGERVRLNQPVTAVEMKEEGAWVVNGEVYTDVIFALPAHCLPAIKAPFDLSLFSDIYYPPVTSVSMGFKRSQFTHPLDGFGVLIPQIEKRFSLGSLFLSSIFSKRAPDDSVLVTTFVGGSMAQEKALLSSEKIESQVLKDLEDLLGLSGPPVYKSSSVYPQAIPQYVLGYQRFLDQMAAIESAHAGIHFAGHYRDGISVGNSILSGLNMAKSFVK